MSAQGQGCTSGDSRCESLIELLHARAQSHPRQLAYQFLIDGDEPGSGLTYSELSDRCTSLARRLADCSTPGDRALLMYSPGVDFVVAFLSCLQAGIVAIPLPPPDLVRAHRSFPRLRSVIRDADAALVLTTSDIQAKIDRKLAGDSLRDVADDLRRLRWIDTLDSVERADSLPGDLPDRSADDLAFLQYTSGSTSESKGVMVSHGNLLQQCRMLGHASGYSDSSIALTWMPYHHDYGLVEGLIVPLSVGATCYIMSPVFFIKRPVSWLKAISKYRVTHSQAPNFAFDLCVRKLKRDDLRGLDLSTWQVAACGAEPVRASTLAEFQSVFADSGLRWSSLSPAYGLAEATLVVAHSRPETDPGFLDVDAAAWEQGRLVTDASAESSIRITSCGPPLDNTDVVIVDPVTRIRREVGQVGEIWVSGPAVTQGYWKRPDSTAETFQARVAELDDGPFVRTGDLGCLHDGELYVCGRWKDLIIIRGRNHYPQDIEHTVVCSHDALRPAGAAAFSVDVDDEEQLVIVQEVEGKFRHGLNSDETLSAIRRAVLEEHDLRPHAVVLLRSGGVLKTTSGKVRRHAMRTAFLNGDLEPVAQWVAGTASRHDTSVPPVTAEPSEITTWLTRWMHESDDILVTDVDPNVAFADCGLDSLLAAELASDLEAWLQRPIEATVFWSHPTIAALAAHLTTEAAGADGHESRTPASAGESHRDAPIVDDGFAIVGMGCRFPGGVDSPEAFWRLLESGASAVSEIPTDRWDTDSVCDPDPDAPGGIYVRRGGFLDSVDEFDPAFFGIAPRDAEDLDPQQRLLLEVAWESLEHAGISPVSLRGTDTGVFVGLTSDDFAVRSRNADSGARNSLGTARSLAAGRIAYVLRVHGPALQIDTACSSSLMAVHQACQSLLSGECSMALAGGVSLMLSPDATIALCELKALAPDGRCKAFDASADGTVRGEGCGIVVLKRMADAVRDGDTILARIRATAANHDGASNGLTAPNPAAQKMLIRSAIRKAGLSSVDVSYVEAHGTGTALGDPIELEALHATYGHKRTESQPLYVGTAKTNIGHLEAAAGVAGLIKTVLVLQHGEIPGSLNLETPTPKFDWQNSQVRVPTETTPWPDPAAVRLAAVSSFGCSGTNSHAIVEAVCQSVDDAAPATGRHILILSARSRPALEAQARRYHRHITDHPEQSLRDICFTAATGRDSFRHRLAVVADCRGKLLTELQTWLTDGVASQVVVGNGKTTVSKVGFLFTGQGAQYVGMGRELYDTEPVFRAALDQCMVVAAESLEVPLQDVLFAESNGSAALVNQTQYTQPAMFALEYALAELWKSWGVTPCGVLGHSIGEYAAACVAGVFPMDVGLKLVAERGRLIQSLPATGEMAVVMAAEEKVDAAINGHRVSIAAINGPSRLVISGVRDDVRAVTAILQADGVDTELLNTSNAGHSHLMQPVLAPFEKTAAGFEFRAPQIPMVSNVTGEFFGSAIADGAYWTTHIRSPVRFADGMQTLAATDCDAFVEIGPDPSLLAMAMESVKDRKRKRRWLPSLARGRSDSETMLYSLAELHVRGFSVDWRAFYSQLPCRRVELPTYPFERQRFPLPQATAVRSDARQSVEPGVADNALASVATDQTPSLLPPVSAVAAQVASRRVGLEDAARELTPRLNEIAIEFAVEALTNLGFNWYEGSEFPELDFTVRIPAENQVKSNRVLSRLVECGVLEHVDRTYRVIRDVDAGNALQHLQELNRKFPSKEAEMLERAGPQLAGIWRGDVDPLTVLFPTGETDEAADFYSNAVLLAGYNQMASDALRCALATMPADATLRILEVGAGTGGLTAHLLPQLPVDRAEYVFTDVSSHFLRKAADRFFDYPFLTTGLLDAGQPIDAQGFEPGTFDIAVAANVLHATPYLHQTLSHVRSLLRPGGWLMLLECANPPVWGDMIFTLIDGWWNFRDTDLRPDYPLMRPDRWTRTLLECGFASTSCLNDAVSGDDSYHTLYLAQADESAAIVPAGSPATATPRALQKADSRVPMTAIATPAVADVDSLPAGMTHEQLRDLIRKHAAQIMRVSADEIEDCVPLADLGMDSLMAVELLTQLKQELDVELSLNPLRMRRSVEEIAKYAIEDHAPVELPTEETAESLANERLNVQRAHVVPLTPTERSLPPLFFIPAGYGDLLAFQEIGNALGRDQPVYGLQPASAKRVKTIRQMSIHRLVSAYMAEIQKVQDDGPYQLAGYSAGAFIAIELARELQRQGKEVSLLVLFDPPTKVPFWLDWLYRCGYRFFKMTRLLGVIQRIRSRWVRRLFHTVLDEGLRTHTTVVREHRVEPYSGHVTYFRSTLSQASFVSMRPVGPFWRRIAQGGLEVHWIPGTHYGMMRESGAKVIVDELYDCLQRARTAAEAKQQRNSS